MMKKLIVVFSLSFISFFASAQVIQSNGTGGGQWSDPGTWVGGVVPTSVNSTSIIIEAGDVVTVDTDFTIDQTIVDGSLIVDPGAVLTIIDGTGTDFTLNGDIVVEGEFVLGAAATHTGMNETNTIFQAGSIYRHAHTTTEGVIPLATWDVASTVIISGYTSATAASVNGNWGQSFGNFEWNCAAKTNSAFNLGGFLTTVNGDLNVLATGAGTAAILNFVTTGSATIDVAGDFNAIGTVRIGFCTSGTTTVNVGGNYNQNLVAGFVRLVNGGTGGIGTLNIEGDFNLLAGTFTETGAAPAVGNINFVGSPGAIHNYFEAGNPITIISNSLAYSVADENELILTGNSQIAGTGSFLTVGNNSILRVESTHTLGAIQNTSGTNNTFGGNIRITTANRVYNPGAQIIYSGSGAQFMAAGQPTTSDITTIIDNTAGVTQVATTTIAMLGDLILQTGNLTITNASLSVGGMVDLQGGDILFTTTGAVRTLTFNGDLNLGGALSITSGTANANLVIAGDIIGGNTISFSGVNSNLTINGTGDLNFPIAGPISLETLTSNRSGEVTFNETINVNTSAGASVMTINDGSLVVNADFNGRNIVLNNGSSALISGNTVLTNQLIVTDGNVQTDGGLNIAQDIILTAGSIDANGTVVIGDAVTLGAGTIFYFDDQTVTINGIITSNGGVFSSNSSSSLNILNAGTNVNPIAFDPAGNELGNFTLNRTTGGTVVTLNSPLIVTGTFNLLDGGFLNTSGLEFGPGAVVTRNSFASFIGGSAVPVGGPYDLFLTGGAMTTGVETQGPVQDVTSNSTGTVTLGGAMNASGNLLINSGVITCGANAVSVVNFTNNGTTFNAPSTTFTVNGDIVNNGAFFRNNGTINFAGNTSISGTVNPAFQNILITGTLTSPATLNLHGAFTNNGIFNSNNGTVAFLGTAAVSQVISGSSVTDFNNISVSNTTANPDVTVASNHNLTGVLTLATSAIFDADGASNTSVFTLRSSGDSPTLDASIATLPTGAQVTGSVTVQRYMAIEGGTTNNGRIYRYISSPVQSAPVSQIQPEIPVTGTFTGTSVCTGCGTAASMFNYNESVITGGIDDGYVAFPVASSAETLTSGRGYAIFVRGNIDPVSGAGSALWDVRGVINSGTINYNTFTTFTSSGVLDNDGWNLVGNPYPSTIDWLAAAGWTKTGINNAVYMRDNGLSSPVYATFVGGVGTNGGSRYIPTGQAYWVKSNGGPINFQSTEAVKVAGQQTTFFREGAPDNMVRVTLKQGSLRDEAVIRFVETASEGFDSEWDAYKLPNAVFNLSSVSSNVKYAINSLSKFDCASSIQLDISNAVPGSYQLEFTEFESFIDPVDIVLVDQFLNKEVDIRSAQSYVFEITSDPKSTADRFKLRIAEPPVNTAIPVTASSTLCEGSEYAVNLSSSEVGVVYFATLNSTPVSETISGTGSELQLNVNEAMLQMGNNDIKIMAQRATCDMVMLTESVEVKMDKIYEVQSVTDGLSCQPGSVTLKASGAPEEGLYRWYDSFEATTPVKETAENQVTSPVLNKSQTYYVSIINSIGCEGTRKEVKAEVVTYDDVELTAPQYGVLTSSYATGNTWYYNDEIILGASGQSISIDQSGVYKVEVSIGGCKTTDTFEFTVTSVEDVFGTVSMYPNPVENELTINLAGKEVKGLQVLSTQGSVMFSEEMKGRNSITVDTHSYAPGLYLVRIIGWNNTVSTQKVVKK